MCENARFIKEKKNKVNMLRSSHAVRCRCGTLTIADGHACVPPAPITISTQLFIYLFLENVIRGDLGVLEIRTFAGGVSRLR